MSCVNTGIQLDEGDLSVSMHHMKSIINSNREKERGGSPTLVHLFAVRSSVTFIFWTRQTRTVGWSKS